MARTGPLFGIGTADVTGPSMLPTLRQGDRLVVRYGARVRPGDLVAALHPLQQDLPIVKRAVERRGTGWWLLSDNPYSETDSRVWGPVPDELILGRIVGRYWPRPSRLSAGLMEAESDGAEGDDADAERLRAR
ncbi:nickel-type superoxide dismutase maturation protease [Mangrovactinospora gilvigrisea]|uniref:Nickel-type superoxide dismutase maturation protease n=1 Tax=Mangrovactinospora gilvigrisea TaxID=1428644 RepID=A0A1J7BA67_9ACTN|nr:nickel-type superoxide dismutase maturation protease [Mangrovactinospora gilvigrisea]OIV35502.1 nickel-type superoxide dismutase maturation protease [Mangrovactinospora gilvigrisea]